MFYENREMSSKEHDWKNFKHGWPYRGDETNKRYLRDREAFFEGHNGWWRLRPLPNHKTLPDSQNFTLTTSRVF